jgi:hypothetical protein
MLSLKSPVDSSSDAKIDDPLSPSLPQDAALLDQIIMSPMAYGTYARPPLKNIIPMATLPSDKLFTSSSSSRRLIVIGDVHGQLQSLKALLSKADYSAARGDHVIFTGDMISKGPDSAGVVALAMEMGASGVRGNHEDRVLLAYENMNTKHVVGTGDGSKQTTIWRSPYYRRETTWIVVSHGP